MALSRTDSPDKGLGWQRRPPADAASSPPSLLVGRGSLTRAVRVLSNDFSVRVLAQGLARPERDGAALLGIGAGRQAWVREVVLADAGVPLIFAHTLVNPVDLIAWPWLRGLGGTPLGEILFGHPRVVRLPLRYRRLDRRHPLYHAARQATGCDSATLWARRSLFRLDGRYLLVAEVFLPALCARCALHEPLSRSR